MAIEDFGGVMFGKPIELVSADALNKPDVAASIARKWWETEGVDMIVGLPTSSTALAVMEVSKQNERIMIVTGAASSDITGKSCSPYTAHWTYDTMATLIRWATPKSNTAATLGSLSLQTTRSGIRSSATRPMS
jgi:branched-chain amino acid transport system substrate-binding protein